MDEKFIWELATDPRVLDVMVELMGPDVTMLSIHVFRKYQEKDPKSFVAWHQNVACRGLEPPIACTAWIAIDESDVDNGSVHSSAG